MTKTEYIQQDIAVKETLTGVCDYCSRPLIDFYESNSYGHLEIYGSYDKHNGDIVGFLCPDCAEGD